MYYLAFAGILNVILNLIFVIVFHMAAVGVATASAIAQYVSGGLILIHLMRRDDMCKVSLRKLRYHNIYGKGILYLGVPSGLQNAIFAIANLSFNPVSTLLMRSWFPEMLPLRMQISDLQCYVCLLRGPVSSFIEVQNWGSTGMKGGSK